MILPFLAAAALALIVWRGWGKPVLTRGQWRVGAGLLSVGALVGAILVSIKGDWPEGLGLLVLGVVLMFDARSRRGPRRPVRPPPPSRGGLSADEARSLLGVTASATAEEIRVAYARLMRMAHPDRGGTTGLAAQLNAARDRLLKG